MADVASLLVRIGADASSYLATCNKTKSATAETFGIMRGILRGANDELTDVLGIKMPAAMQQGIRGMEAFSGAMFSMGGRMKWTSDVAKMSGAQLGSLAEGAFRLGQMIGTWLKPWADEALGIAHATSMANDATTEWVATLAGSEELYQRQLTVYDRLRLKLHETSAEYQIGTDRTKENALRLAIMTDVLIAHSRAMLTVKPSYDRLTADMIALGEAVKAQTTGLHEGGLAVGEFIDDLKKAWDISDTTTPRQQIAKLTEDFRLLAASGKVTGDQLEATFLPKVEDLAAQMDKAGISLPKPFADLKMALEQGQGAPQVLDQFVTKIKKDLPDATAIAKEALNTTADSFGDSIRNARGELTKLGTDLTTLAKNDWAMTIKVKADFTDFDRELRSRGQNPDTGGRLPGP